MAPREHGIDGGVSAQLGGAWGLAFAELLRDVSQTSGGSELRLGYKYPFRRGRLWLRPHVMLSVRDERLNNYYYGVRPEEARADRPAYEAQSGVVPEVGFYAAYQLSTRWRLLGGVTFSRLPDTVAGSPIVAERILNQYYIGAAYDLSAEQEQWPQGRPLIVRALYGASSDCDVLKIMTLRCTSVHTVDETGIAGLEVGWPLIERLNGWPLDVAGFVGVTQHLEKGLQSDFPEIKGYIKAYFYGFPWDAKLRTRLGLGVGLSWAKQIPFSEARDLEAKGRNTSHLLEVLDPTADMSLGDLLGGAQPPQHLLRRRCVAPLGHLRQLAALGQRQRRLELHLRLRRDLVLGGRFGIGGGGGGGGGGRGGGSGVGGGVRFAATLDVMDASPGRPEADS